MAARPKKETPKAVPSLSYKPRNSSQRLVRELWPQEQITLLALQGPAGTGKTTAALAEAFLDVFAKRKRCVYLARPTISVEEDLGFFPGTLEEKLGPWLPAFRDVFGELCHDRLDKLSGLWEAVSVGMLRGRTITNATLIVDEAQNCSYSQLKCIVTRPGRNSRIVLCGDASQSDLTENFSSVPLGVFARHIAGTPGYREVLFNIADQVRHPFVSAVLASLSKHER